MRIQGRHDALAMVYLEDHRHSACKLDDFSACQAELLVVIHHRVHVLDPDVVCGSLMSLRG